MSWVRVQINGNITTTTEMKVGDGHARSGGDDAKGEVMTVVKDGNGRPMIPGTTLKGVLRSFAENQLDAPTDAINSLFGRGSNDEIDSALGGKVSVGCCYVLDNADLKVEYSVAIDRLTRTAADRQLFAFELVSEGTKFETELVVENPSKEELAILIAALNGISTDLPNSIRIGSGSSNRDGCANWRLQSLTGVTEEQLESWFSDNSSSGFWDCGSAIQLDELNLPEAKQNSTIVIDLTLQFDSWFMMRDPKPNLKGVPDAEAKMTKDGKILLPQRSFRGAFRSQVEKIARTIDSDAGGDPNTKRNNTRGLIEALFGSILPPALIGGIEFDHLIDEKPSIEVDSPTVETFLDEIDFVEQTPRIKREFVAIDRFTGGVAGEFKFDAIPAWRPKLVGKIHINLSVLKRNCRECGVSVPAALGLIAMALRDLAEGDLTFGMGSSKGFGRCRGTIGSSGEQSLPDFGLDSNQDPGTPDWCTCPELARFLAGCVEETRQHFGVGAK